MHRMVSSLLAAAGLAGAILAPGHAQAASLKTLANFCTQTNCADGSSPFAGLIADANGNLFGTTVEGGAHDNGTVFEIGKTATGYASTPTILVSFCALANCADGAAPRAGLIVDTNGNLFGTMPAARCSRSLRPPPATPAPRPPWSASARWPLVPMARIRWPA